MGRTKQAVGYDYFNYTMPQGLKERQKAIAFAQGRPLSDLYNAYTDMADLLREAAKASETGGTVEVWLDQGQTVVALDGRIVKI